MNKVSLFLTGAIFGLLLEQFRHQDGFEILSVIFYAIMVWIIIDLILEIKIKLEKKRMKKFFDIAREEIDLGEFIGLEKLEKKMKEKHQKEIEKEIKDTGVAVVGVNIKDGKVIKSEVVKGGPEKKDFVYKAHLQKMTKKELIDYLAKCKGVKVGKTDYLENTKTRKDLIDTIIKQKFYKTRKQSDNPK